MLDIRAFTQADWDFFNDEEHIFFQFFKDGSQPLKAEIVYMKDFRPTRGQFLLIADGEGLHLMQWVEGPEDFVKRTIQKPQNWDIYEAIDHMEALMKLYDHDTPEGIIMHFEFMAAE